MMWNIWTMKPGKSEKSPYQPERSVIPFVANSILIEACVSG
jgi:hypothetical protein